MKKPFALLVAAAVSLAAFASLATRSAAAPMAFSFGGFGQAYNDTLTPEETAGAAYCKSTGGEVEKRVPVYGTNNPKKQWLLLSGHAIFCQYTAKDGSRIHVLASTLNATMPTLAALAYYSKTPFPSSSSWCPGGANPASCYCTYLGGSDLFGGKNLGGGAWYHSTGIDKTLEACVFPDMSSIDSWGLAYHSNGTIRGTDLSKVLRFKNPFKH